MDYGGSDFLSCVKEDNSVSIFRLLNDPADIARAAAVSRSWRRFIIDNKFCKSLCLRICPDAANFTRAVEDSRSPLLPSASASESCKDAELRISHRIWSNLGGALISSSTKPSMNCIELCICASSTLDFPHNTMENTLEPQDQVNLVPSYWCSKGQHDLNAPESLIYRLNSDLCIIDEISLKPFKAYFEQGHPIYSCKTVRIRMGHSKLDPAGFLTDDNENLTAIADENYVWTYTSPEFPMLQENVLQTFKLPRPVLCIGGVVKIELLGRIEKKATDDRYYICVSHAQVIGRLLSPDFKVVPDPAGYSILKYLPDTRNLRAEDTTPNGVTDSFEQHAFVARYRQIRQRAWLN